ncbi:hypothetical protein VPLG_00215 [Vibrio phage eugene 12A10]|uniref:hypothetical protein n=1 Tax=Vibrio phage eugene 12A10 TaxID=573172 RepID=UPI0003517ADB|nr:hypothetical protein VPLG_00215 [Vibrio phage eugene 12A10]AGN51654.1 hypothetical protein VPLG_00215 [Vibrio phage eugene 12A10]
MKNKKAKQLMFGCIKSRDNGECYLVEQVHITGNLQDGSVITYSKFLGGLDTQEVFDNVEKFCKRLGL